MGLLVTPRNYVHPDGLVWAADNDAFSGFDERRYIRMAEAIASWEGCRFVTVPDVVGDAAGTDELFPRWEATIHGLGLPVAYVLQNGVRSVPWDSCEAVFVGGDTTFKYSDIVRRILAEAKELGKWTHVGRVNTRRRIEYIGSLGTVDSFDGSQFARWSKTHLPWGARATEHVQGRLV